MTDLCRDCARWDRETPATEHVGPFGETPLCAACAEDRRDRFYESQLRPEPRR